MAVSLLPTGTASADILALSWQDNSEGAAEFKIERKAATAGTYAQIGMTAPGVTTFQDNTVDADATYCYRVRASGPGGDSNYSNEACGSSTTAPSPTGPSPTGPVITAAKTGAGSGAVTSSPTGVSCGSDCFESFPSGTVVMLTATPASGSAFSGWTTGCSGTGQCTISGNTPVTVTAAFAAAPATDTTPPTTDTTPPTTVTGLVASAVGSAQVNLNWTASTDAVGVTGYRVERCAGRRCSGFVQIGAPSGPGYSDTGLSPKTVYRYRVRATDAAGNLGGYSQIVGTTTFKAGR